MRELEKLRREKEQIMQRAHVTLDRNFSNVENHLDQVKDEYGRVVQLSGQAGYILDRIDKDFREKTKLSSGDTVFLFLCVALQCARQYLIPNNAFRLTAMQGDQLVENTLGVVLPKSWQDILLGSVPYDAVRHVEGIETGISGTTHRYRTLGHDPVLGWIFGTANILSNSLTKSDIITTYLVQEQVVTGLYPGGTPGMLGTAYHAIERDPLNLPAALAKQAIHFGTDYFTKQSLPIPFLGTLSPETAHLFMNSSMKNCPSIDMFSITRQAALSALINQIIYYLHQFFYVAERDGSQEMYKVRTRKILSYSNAIATGSNFLVTAITKNLSKLDVGGALVTLYRLVSDYQFIHAVKRDFLKNEYYNMVLGEPYDFMKGVKISV